MSSGASLLLQQDNMNNKADTKHPNPSSRVQAPNLVADPQISDGSGRVEVCNGARPVHQVSCTRHM